MSPDIKEINSKINEKAVQAAAEVESQFKEQLLQLSRLQQGRISVVAPQQESAAPQEVPLPAPISEIQEPIQPEVAQASTPEDLSSRIEELKKQIYTTQKEFAFGNLSAGARQTQYDRLKNELLDALLARKRMETGEYLQEQELIIAALKERSSIIDELSERIDNEFQQRVKERREGQQPAVPPEAVPETPPAVVVPEAAPTTPSVEPEVLPPNPEEILEGARASYIKEYQEYQKSKKQRISFLRRMMGVGEGKEEPPAELKLAKEKYDEEKLGYGRFLYDKKIEELTKSGVADPAIEEELTKYRIELFEQLVMKEKATLQHAQIETWPPKDRNIMSRALGWWMQQKSWKRLLISSAIMTGTFAAAPLLVPAAAGFASASSAITFGALRLVRGSIGAISAQGVGKGVDWIFSRALKKGEDEAIEVLKRNFSLEEFREFEEDYQYQLNETARLSKIKNYTKWAAMWATGYGAANITEMGLGWLGETYAGGSRLQVSKEIPPSPKPSLGPSPLRQPEVVSPEAPPSAAAPLAPEAPAGAPAVPPAETPVISGVAPEDFIEAAQKGDSIWKMAERQLAEHYGQKFTGLNEAQKTYIIDAIKDRVAENQESFGLADVDKIKIGQKVDLSSIFNDEEGMARLFNQTGELTQSQMESITEHNTALRDWVREHPGEHLTSQKAEEILTGTRGDVPEELEPPTDLEPFKGHETNQSVIEPEAADAKPRLDDIVFSPEEAAPPKEVPPRPGGKMPVEPESPKIPADIDEGIDVTKADQSEPPVVIEDLGSVLAPEKEEIFNKAIFSKGASLKEIRGAVIDLAQQVKSGKVTAEDFASYLAIKAERIPPGPQSLEVVNLKAILHGILDEEVSEEGKEFLIDKLIPILKELRRSKPLV